MSAVTDFLSELIRAANEIEKLSAFEKRRLFERSVAITLELREAAGIPTNRSDADKLVDVAKVSNTIRRRTNEQAREALLTAAGMIRDLRVVIDTKVEIIFDEIRRS